MAITVGGSPNHTGGNWPGSMTPTQPTCPKILNSIFFFTNIEQKSTLFAVK